MLHAQSWSHARLLEPVPSTMHSCACRTFRSSSDGKVAQRHRWRPKAPRLPPITVMSLVSARSGYGALGGAAATGQHPAGDRKG